MEAAILRASLSLSVFNDTHIWLRGSTPRYRLGTTYRRCQCPFLLTTPMLLPVAIAPSRPHILSRDIGPNPVLRRFCSPFAHHAARRPSRAKKKSSKNKHFWATIQAPATGSVLPGSTNKSRRSGQKADPNQDHRQKRRPKRAAFCYTFCTESAHLRMGRPSLRRMARMSLARSHILWSKKW